MSKKEENFIKHTYTLLKHLLKLKFKRSCINNTNIDILLLSGLNGLKNCISKNSTETNFVKEKI